MSVQISLSAKELPTQFHKKLNNTIGETKRSGDIISLCKYILKTEVIGSAQQLQHSGTGNRMGMPGIRLGTDETDNRQANQGNTSRNPISMLLTNFRGTNLTSTSSNHAAFIYPAFVH